MNRLQSALGVALCLGASSLAGADNIIVPGDFDTIQEAIVAAVDGDCIVVAPGTYVENINFLSKGITVRSTDPTNPKIVASTIVFGGGEKNSTVECSGCSPESVLDGLTVTGGRGAGGFVGGGMYIDRGDPTVMNCVFVDNEAGIGGGIGIDGGCPTIVHCTFERNRGLSDGGGVAGFDAEPTLIDCIFVENVADGGSGGGVALDSVTMVNCLFRGNVARGGSADGGGAWIDAGATAPSIVNCTFSGNVAGRRGGGLFIDDRPAAPARLTNCIVWDNEPDAIFSVDMPINTIVEYCDVQGGWTGPGGNNIDADPLFVDRAVGNLRLTAVSPCIDAGDVEGVPKEIIEDLDGNPRFVDDECIPDTGRGAPTVDLGAFEQQAPFIDCNENGDRDNCEILEGKSEDCNQNGVPDECEEDCNENGEPDDCDIAEGRSEDCNLNGVPDECEEDCNENGKPDDCDLAEGRSEDCNLNGIPDECDIAEGRSEDCNLNGIPDECELICGAEIIFVLDTSGSMDNDLPLGCLDMIERVITELDLMLPGKVDARIWGVASERECTNGTVIGALGTSVPGEPGACGLILDSDESWGPATAIVADLFAWQTTSRRFIVPFSDEGPCEGAPCCVEPGTGDRDAIDNAAMLASAKGVVAFPVTGLDSDECTQTLTDLLAERTGGRSYHREKETSYEAIGASLLQELADRVLLRCRDCDSTGVPDDCECPADIDRNTIVELNDLLLLLSNWGACPPPCYPCSMCRGDLDLDCAVDFDDLLTLLVLWGPCK